MKPRKPVRNPGWSYKRLDYSVEGESLFRVTVNFKNNPEWRDIDIVLARNKKEA